MGNNTGKIAFEICIVTGDYQGDMAGPDVVLILFDEKDNKSAMIKFEQIFQGEPNYTTAVSTVEYQDWAKTFGKIHHIEFWRTATSIHVSDWYMDRVIIRDRRNGLTGDFIYYFFPVHDWIIPEMQYVVMDCDSVLPMHDPYPERRHIELTKRHEAFVLTQRDKGLPVEVEQVPASEVFSSDAKWDVEGSIQILVEKNHIDPDYQSLAPWSDIKTLGNIFVKYSITKPLGLQYWMFNNICFGAQRLRGCNPLQIRCCTELPREFNYIESELKHQYFEGWDFKQLITARRLFIIDYSHMSKLEAKSDRVMCGPVALFLYTAKRQLIPIAIKLNVNRDYDEPIFLPKNECNLWLQAKLWFNMADAINHFVLQRLLNHMILESVYALLRKNVSQNHPIYQILAPHFRNILVVTRKLKEWFFGQSWLSSTIQLSQNGIRQLLRKGFKEWSFNKNCNIYQDLNSRGVYSQKVLGNYPFREDALLVHKTFDNFATKYVKLVYKTPEDIWQDSELQNWRKEITLPMAEGGLELRDIPGSAQQIPRHPLYLSDINNEFTSLQSNVHQMGFNNHEEVTKFISGLWYLLVIVCGSAVRTPMFDEYGFVANYTLGLRGMPPGFSFSQKDGTIRSNDSENQSTLESIVQSLPNRHETLDTILNIRLSHRVGQSVLGKYESEYIFDPEAVVLLNEFRTELEDTSRRIKDNNSRRDQHHKYFVLDPELMPNYPGP